MRHLRQLLGHHRLRLRLLPAPVLRGRSLRVRRRCPLPDSPPLRRLRARRPTTATFYDADGQVIRPPIRSGARPYRLRRCRKPSARLPRSNTPPETRCPIVRTARSHPPSASDPYLGATITPTTPTAGSIQVTNPLGRDHPHHLRRCQQRHSDRPWSPTTPRAIPISSPPTPTTPTTASPPPSATGVVGKATTTQKSYDPDGNVYCIGLGQRHAAGGSDLPVPALAGRLDRQPPDSCQPVLEYADLGPGQQRDHHLLQR